MIKAAERHSSWDAAKKLFEEGNFREALTAYRELLQSKPAAANQITTGFEQAQSCMNRLRDLSELDEMREQVVATHAEKWEVLSTVAHSYLHSEHQGFWIAGEFQRGRYRGGGKAMNATERDRVRGLQLYWQALQLIEASSRTPGVVEANWLSEQFARAIGNRSSWRLQELTDLTQLPDYEEGYGRGGGTTGAPVNGEGRPILYELPASWEEAQNDGERWRWLLHRAETWAPEQKNRIQIIRARFLQSQFGVETLRRYESLFVGRGLQEDPQKETGTFALHTLGENETIARLATGIQRFELPDEHNHLKIYQEILTNDSKLHKVEAARLLAHLFANRRQFDKAAKYWKLCQSLAPRDTSIQEELDQIQGNWGRFEPVMSQPAGKGATVDFRFRNGKRVEFTAKRIDIRKLLGDIKTYLNENPHRIERNKIDIHNLGYRLIHKNQDQYLGQEVARWSLDLNPLENHFDRRITVTTPLQDAGAYLLTSKMDDGNETHVVLWLSDTAIVKKPLGKKALYYVSDSVTGKPLADCNVEFFGYWQQHVGGRKFNVHTKNFAEKTDSNGLVELPADDKTRLYQWICVATDKQGRFAFLGFDGIWMANYKDQRDQQTKAFAITDRPVYRPEQEVQFKFWVRDARYDLDETSNYAGQAFQVEVKDPKNETVLSTQLTADTYGGLAGYWQIPKGATLGQYSIILTNHGTSTFRVEEYKKPEFEVKIDAPEEIVKLGEKFTATISARYYYGEPVTSATVKYKVLRTNYNSDWYPPMPWDWLYGPGYWWFAPESDWYPGWGRWGCRAPSPWWFWRSPTRPEVVMEQEVEIGPNGTVEVEIDSALAQQFHPDKDHSYQLQAEVVDQSRRTIVGNGTVLVAKEPFKVYVWADRGYYRVGDTVGINTAIRTLNGNPVEETGILRLLRVQYEDAQPVETEVGRWDLATDESGVAHFQLKASEAGQYRVSFELTDEEGRKFEGGQLITISGEGFDGSEFRFNDLELIPEKRDYAPGDKVALQINTNRIGATVLLFAKPVEGIYLPPQVVRLQGKSQIVEIDVQAKDSPNFFVEGVTVHSGKVHQVVREIFVPPAKRILNVEVVPSSEAYLPGQAASLLLKLTDGAGKPFVGSMVISVYDKALEYISGGSNVPDIREFFWKWRRNHRSQGQSNLTRSTNVQVKEKQSRMKYLGIFGAGIVDEYSNERLNINALQAVPLAGSAPRGAAVAADAMMESADFSGAVSKSRIAPMEAEADAQQTVQPMIRQEFADTALWIGSIETNAEGIAEAKLEMPENLTAWKIRTWAMGHGTRVGEGSAEVVTRKNLVLRMQAPRFFVEKDEVFLSANVHNYLTDAKQVVVKLELDGDTLLGPDQLEQTVDIPAGEEVRVDWRVNVRKEGTATIRMSALTDEESDAMQKSFPVHVHGMLKTDSFAGVIRPDKESGQFTVEVPSERRPEQTQLEIRYTPTLAGAMVDALPYLLDYPYGCTEQTLNRFLPAVLTQKTLKNMGLNLAAIQEKRTNLNSQEIDDDQERAKAWKRFDKNPVFDEAELNKIVKAGVNRLTEMQLSDGGWGWFSGWGERSSAHTTAVVMHGLLVARQNDVAIVRSVFERGVAWLEDYQAEQLRWLDNAGKKDDQGKQIQPYKTTADNLDALVCMVLAEANRDNDNMRDYLYRDRTKLSVYGLATFGITLQKSGDKEKLAMVMRNLSQYVKQDEENQTAWLDLPTSSWWYWHGSEFEAHAYYLKLLSAQQPKSNVASRMVKYLLNNRKHATYWNSTRDTALVLEAFSDYLQVSGEDNPEVTVEIWIDGELQKEVAITRDNLFSFDNKLILAGEKLSTGRHTVEIRKEGKSPIYFNGYLTNFTMEDDIKATGLELKVERKYYKLTPKKKTESVAGGRGQVVQQQIEKYERMPLVRLSTLKSGDLVEVELTVDSKNDYEYILLEDMKAAGFEPVEIRSGYNGNALGAYMELRDDRVSLFVSRLPRGKHTVSYRLRAEIPGRFSALPTRASAMYAPELKANSDEIKLRISD